MAADNELRLLSRAVRTRDIAPLLEAGVQDSWFFTDDNRAVWQFLKNHWTKYSEVPTAVTLKDNFPTYRLLAVEDTLEYLLDQLIEYRKRQSIIEVVQNSAEQIAGGDHNAAIDLMGQGLAKINDEGTTKSTDINLAVDPMDRFTEYMAVKTRPNGLLGMATGFSTIDQATAGLQPEQLVTIIAPAKTGKSILALQMAINIHEDGFVPMFQSFEMTNFEQQRRHDAMRAKIANSRLMRGTLTPPEELKYKDALTRMATMHNFYLTDSHSSLTLGGISLKIDKLRPDVVFIDGVYLMTDERTGERGTPQALTNLTRDLKTLAQKKKIPIVLTTQTLPWKTKKGRVTADSIGYSSSFIQDSDVILSLQRQDAEDDSSRELKIELSRNCGPATADLLWDWEAGRFEEYGLFAKPI